MSCCGTLKFMNTASSACSGTIGSPLVTYWPTFTWRMPVTPANGARMVLRSIVACAWPTAASADLNWALATS